jgi:integrase
MMKGRPITGEEFDRMLAVVPKVRPKDAPTWQRYLTGLWLSGLRLKESLALSWDPEAPFSVDLTGRRPAFRILAEAQKANRDELLPMTPDLAQWILESTPEVDRVGPVFRLPSRLGRPLGIAQVGRVVAQVGRVVAQVGRAAKVLTDKRAGSFATAHDLRRSFGTRWAKRVMPAVLQRLMRHAEIQTTMRFYVGLNADEVADELWDHWMPESDGTAVGNTLGNSAPETALQDERY